MDFVIEVLSKALGYTTERCFQLMLQTHNSGRAIVWTGPKETAELYWEQLKDAGLTMAPLEQH